MHESVLGRLWAKVDIGRHEECWPFTGSLLKGYGRIGLGTRAQGTGYANRVIAEAFHGPAPSPQHQARHLCGNRACCNPRHIAWGTQSENEADKIAHGRSNRGERHGMAKLVPAEVEQIRRLAGQGKSQRYIADVFGITQQSVSDIVTGRTWGWQNEKEVMPS
jgi:hypothetical protein